MVVGYSYDDAFDVVAVEQVLVTASGRQARVPGDLLGQRMSAVIQVRRRHALAAQLERRGKQAGTLHTDAYDSEPNTVTPLRTARGRLSRVWIEEHRLGDERPSCGRYAPLQEVAA